MILRCLLLTGGGCPGPHSTEHITGSPACVCNTRINGQVGFHEGG
jgi:hypothetical protein